MQGMAAKQARKCVRDSANESISFNGLEGVFRTSRCKATGGRKPWRDNQLVSLHSLYRDRPRNRQTHFSAPSRATNSPRKSSRVRSMTDRRGLSTKSNPSGIAVSEVRRISLILLLIRFLSCAFPSFRGVVKPNRL